ncbi:hypothetical protein EVAR_49815_1 [Eumeta japonica]|uniref:Uncharacterized protein n=1 Tax=Eumeta variegata TaxID=151549 RepID=A0A4C1XPF8_EUMVA|nr:hypothetical protein EVAR_49815_1 [Eumeta japonica]
MRTGKRNRHRRPDSPDPNPKSKRDDIAINKSADLKFLLENNAVLSRRTKKRKFKHSCRIHAVGASSSRRANVFIWNRVADESKVNAVALSAPPDLVDAGPSARPSHSGKKRKISKSRRFTPFKARQTMTHARRRPNKGFSNFPKRVEQTDERIDRVGLVIGSHGNSLCGHGTTNKNYSLLVLAATNCDDTVHAQHTQLSVFRARRAPGAARASVTSGR